jgi:hypothetical protein
VARLLVRLLRLFLAVDVVYQRKVPAVLPANAAHNGAFVALWTRIVAVAASLLMVFVAAHCHRCHTLPVRPLHHQVPQLLLVVSGLMVLPVAMAHAARSGATVARPINIVASAVNRCTVLVISRHPHLQYHLLKCLCQ